MGPRNRQQLLYTNVTALTVEGEVSYMQYWATISYLSGHTPLLVYLIRFLFGSGSELPQASVTSLTRDSIYAALFAPAASTWVNG
eukprot:CAMPEP_0202914398 /NCGR_PEP_ID=MMETSP1392-20130828/62968_1 /ASSEMBLY_ACC=CAM_ASM_000868 /TAXON_ID=225041 /ORGANISM="Chlamydomonas chlamydogama, Strain SAG 11-48b" /LENGTH=84 /DNA_ID=CAMNT_0049606023 /DNA_START=73 /DNA_END=323 /DNA_ORIENTATION=+